MLDRTRSARWLEALFGIVLGIEALSFAVNFFRADMPAGPIIKGE